MQPTIASGYLLFTRRGVLLRQRFDPTRLEVSGETTPVAERVARTLAIGLAAFSVSATGVLAFQTEADASTQFAWFDRTGKQQETVGPQAATDIPPFHQTENAWSTRTSPMASCGSSIWLAG